MAEGRARPSVLPNEELKARADRTFVSADVLGALVFLISAAFAKMSVCCCQAAAEPVARAEGALLAGFAGLHPAALTEELGASDHSAHCSHHSGPWRQETQVPWRRGHWGWGPLLVLFLLPKSLKTGFPQPRCQDAQLLSPGQHAFLQTQSCSYAGRREFREVASEGLGLERRG